jgi:DNA-binding MarR family transcriptional regulator
VAGIKQQIADLRNGVGGSPGDRIFLFRTLDILTQSETGPTMGELSAELGIPLSSATRMADGLVRANFAERCADPGDRRVVRLCMTATGRQFVRTATGYIRQHIVDLLGHLTADEQAQLLRLMTKLIDSVEAGHK